MVQTKGSMSQSLRSVIYRLPWNIKSSNGTLSLGFQYSGSLSNHLR